MKSLRILSVLLFAGLLLSASGCGFNQTFGPKAGDRVIELCFNNRVDDTGGAPNIREESGTESAPMFVREIEGKWCNLRHGGGYYRVFRIWGGALDAQQLRVYVRTYQHDGSLTPRADPMVTVPRADQRNWIKTVIVVFSDDVQVAKLN